MREIKFRAWDKDEEEMFFPDYIGGYGTIYELGSDPVPRETKNCVLMQFTGLHDKNGKEIYEGDIVQSYSGGGDFLEKDVVRWDVGFAAFFPFFEIEFPYPEETIEIVGNIYQNPDLTQKS